MIMTILKNIHEKGSGRQKGPRAVVSGVFSVQIGDKHQKSVIRIAGYESTLCEEMGFVLVPDGERARWRIDAYLYLIR